MATEHGLTPADYGEPRIAQALDALKSRDQAGSHRTTQLAELDVTLTAALLALGRDVALGRTRPKAVDRRWKIRRLAPDAVARDPAYLTRNNIDVLLSDLKCSRSTGPEGLRKYGSEVL